MRISKVVWLSLLASWVTQTASFQFSNPLKRRISLNAENNEKKAMPFYSTFDVSIPYDAAAKLAYESSDKSLTYDKFKAKYLEEAVALVKSKQPNFSDVSIPYDAAAKLAYESSDKSLGYDDFKAKYLEEAVGLVKSKQKSTPKPPKKAAPKQKLVPSEKFFVNRLEREKEKLFGATFMFLKDNVAPVVKREVSKEVKEFKRPSLQRGVPTESVKGAALLTAGLALVATKGVALSGAAGVTAALTAIQQGKVGDVFRKVGGVTWDVTSASTKLVKQATSNEKVTGMTKELAANVVDKVKQSRTIKATTAEQTVVPDETSDDDIVRVLEEAEAAIDQADAAMALANETLKKSEEKEEEEDKDEETEEEESVRLQEELKLAKEEVRLEEESTEQQDEEEEADEYVADENDDEWEMTLELAQQGIEGKIVGLDEVIEDDGAKADWDAAGVLAQELQQASVDDDEEYDEDDDEAFTEMGDDEMLPEGNLEDIARAAREAVEMMENVNGEEEVAVFDDKEEEESPQPKVSIRDWSKLTVAKLRDELRSRGLKAYGKKAELIATLEQYDADTLTNSFEGDAEESASDSDFDLDFEDDADMEEIGRQARAAVQAYESVDSSPVEDDRDDDILGTDDFFANIDLNALGEEARAAVDAQFMEEPTDDVLQELENELENELLVDEPTPAEKKDYSSMTVAQLKVELRDKGLKVSGKKAELIERLQSA